MRRRTFVWVGLAFLVVLAVMFARRWDARRKRDADLSHQTDVARLETLQIRQDGYARQQEFIARYGAGVTPRVNDLTAEEKAELEALRRRVGEYAADHPKD